MAPAREWLSAVAIFASGLAHVLGWLSLGDRIPSLEHRSPPASVVDFEVPPPAPVRDDPPPPAPSPPVPSKVVPRPAPPKEKPEAKAAPEPPPVAPLSGVTLTGNASNTTWASPAGNGEIMNAPLPAIGSGPPSKADAPPPSPAPVAREAQVVPLRDLSTKPRPPSLDAVLQRNYPADARGRGLGGSAVVAARIEPDGAVRTVRVQSESDAGFGEACRRTLLASRWSPPLDASGRPALTEIRYTCRFQVMP